MPKSYIKIALLNPLVLSNSSATAGLHSSHRIIPGSRLLGTAATRHDWSNTADGFRLFRAGTVRFGNGYPLSKEGKVCYPVPRALHKSKPGTGEVAHKQTAFDMSSGKWIFGSMGQPKQLREAFMARDGSMTEVLMQYSLRSAHDIRRGSAREAQLFGYMAIEAGQDFVAEISADNQDDLDTVLDYLTGVRFMGRSKASEYGRVNIEVLGEIGATVSPPAVTKGVSLWAIGDVYFVGDNGEPVTVPDANHFRVENAEIDWPRSYVHRKQFAPYNGHYKAREMERTGFAAGSVFRFKPINGTSISITDDLFSAAIGAYQESGAGRVLPMPDTNDAPITVSFSDGEHQWGTVGSGNSLIKLLKARQQRQNRTDATLAYLEGDVCTNFITKVRRLSRNGPSRSQWRRVLNASLSPTDRGFMADLFNNLDDNTKGICSDNKKGWNEVRRGLHEILQHCQRDELDIPLLLKRLITRIFDTAGARDE